VNALSEVLSALPADFPAAIAIVLHHAPSFSAIADILSSRTLLSIKQAESGDLLRPKTIYIAPPDRHLLVNPDSTVSVYPSELVHFVRPSAELLFESVAASFKQRAIAVVLTGTGSDGTMGIQAIKEMGGTAIALERTVSDFNMPEAAIDNGVVQLPLNQIAENLVNLVKSKQVQYEE
jgi:two-component system chemotaxis response regulator CheB